MLPLTNVKEELSISYINAIAAVCKFGFEVTRVDFDSIDATITSNGKLTAGSVFRSPELKLQLKATERLALNKEGKFVFPLKKKNYDDLRGNTLTPRLLVVLNLPDVENQWLTHSINDLIIRKCAYWLNLKGLPDVANTESVTVYIPRSNVFSPDSLNEIMIKVSKQESI